MRRKGLVALAAVAMICLFVVLGSTRTQAAGGDFEAGDIVELGSYPQTMVTDETLIATLNKQSKTWKNYPYFSKNTGSDQAHYPSMLNENLMKYADFSYGGVKYRAVVINQYLACATINLPEESECQSLFPFEKNKTYYFVWEPIKWVVLDPDSGLVVSQMNLDAQPFCCSYMYDDTDKYQTLQGSKYLPNNFCRSTIRSWLNADTQWYDWYSDFNFLNHAFTTSEKSVILVTEIEDYQNLADNTFDRVFLLSKEEIETYNSFIPLAKNTDYARSQGKNGSEGWYTRTPDENNENTTLRSSGLQLFFVLKHNAITNDSFLRRVSSTVTGTRPAMHVNLSASILIPVDSFTIQGSSNQQYPCISWNGDEVSNAKYFNLYRCPVDQDPDTESNWKKVLYTSESSSSVSDDSANREVTYCYKMTATNSQSQIVGKSNIVMAHGHLPAAAVSTSTDTFGTGKPVLTWSSTGASKYQVLRKKDGTSSWTIIATTTALTYKDTSAVAKTTYLYAVRSVSAAGSEYNSVLDPDKGRREYCRLPDVKIKEFVMVGSTPTIRWEAVSGADYYKITVTPSGKSSYSLGTTTATSITDPNVPLGILVSYEIIACTNAGSNYNSRSVSFGKTWPPAAPVITTQPKSTSVTVGSTAKFTVAALGAPSLSYQWQYKAPGATKWYDSTQPGSKTDTLSITTNVNHNGYQYRCMVTDGNGKSTPSNGATLTVKPKITTQPKSTTVEVGDTAVFTVAATGKATLKYQWQYLAPGSSTWSDSTQPGAKTTKLTITTNVNHNGYKYRCVVTDGNGKQTTSNEVTLTIKPKITKQPANKTVNIGNTAEFTVAATGKATLKYQWQYLAPGSSTWRDSTQTGAKTTKLSVQTNENHHGYKYRCIVTDGNGKKNTSKEATLTIKPKITTQPTAKTVTAGTTVYFTVAATGKATLKYQWQYLAPGSSTWKDSTQTGAKTTKLTIKTTTNHNGYKYRCVVTDGNNQSTTSNEVKLTVK